MTEMNSKGTYSYKAWDEKRIELLTKLWANGLSAQQVADRLGGVTRNAVIGKVHRLGLSGRASHEYSPRSRKRRLGPKPAKPAKASRWLAGNWRNLFADHAEPFIPSTEELVIPLAERKIIETLEETHCRWPIGDPKEADFHFCGKSKVAGLSYCEFHARRAYRPPEPRRAGNPSPVRAQLPWLMRQQLDEVTA